MTDISDITKTNAWKKISYSVLVHGYEETINNGNMKKNEWPKFINDDGLANSRKQ